MVTYYYKKKIIMFLLFVLSHLLSSVSLLLDAHLGVKKKGVVKIGFTPHRLLANICINMKKKKTKKKQIQESLNVFGK